MNQHPLARDEFVLPILRVVRNFGKVQVKHYLHPLEEELGTADRVILSGTPLRDHEHFRHPEAFSWLAGFKRPVLGICAGMQQLAGLSGSRVVDCLEIGMIRVETTSENPLFSGNFEAYALHSKGIVPSGELEVLARSDETVHAFRHRERELYGVLFHPEVRNQDILRRFCEL